MYLVQIHSANKFEASRSWTVAETNERVNLPRPTSSLCKQYGRDDSTSISGRPSYYTAPVQHQFSDLCFSCDVETRSRSAPQPVDPSTSDMPDTSRQPTSSIYSQAPLHGGQRQVNALPAPRTHRTPRLWRRLRSSSRTELQAQLYDSQRYGVHCPRGRAR